MSISGRIGADLVVLSHQFLRLASQKPTVTHLKVNVDESPKLSGQYEIRSIPTTMFLRDGIVVGRIAGALSATRLADLIKQTEDLDLNKIKGKVKP